MLIHKWNNYKKQYRGKNRIQSLVALNLISKKRYFNVTISKTLSF